MPSPIEPRRGIRRRSVVAVVLSLLMGMTMVACSGADGPASTADTANRDDPRQATARPVDEALRGFKQVMVTVVDADGTSRRFCLWLADTEVTRQQGLMYIDDRELGGLAGMLFAFESDSSTGFWMKNTLLPLSIAYLRADGSTVSTTDMQPCPADTENCPVYPAGGGFRYAIEVPRGELDRLGISDRSRIEIGSHSCTKETIGTAGSTSRS